MNCTTGLYRMVRLTDDEGRAINTEMLVQFVGRYVTKADDPEAALYGFVEVTMEEAVEILHGCSITSQESE
jgi:hypothetical protein